MRHALPNVCREVIFRNKLPLPYCGDKKRYYDILLLFAVNNQKTSIWTIRNVTIVTNVSLCNRKANHEWHAHKVFREHVNKKLEKISSISLTLCITQFV